MHDVQVGTDLRIRIDVRDLLRRGIGCAAKRPIDAFVDGKRAVMATQTCERDALWTADRRIQRRAAVRREPGRGSFVIPQRDDLRVVSVMRLVTGAANTFAGVPRRIQ